MSKEEGVGAVFPDNKTGSSADREAELCHRMIHLTLRQCKPIRRPSTHL